MEFQIVHDDQVARRELHEVVAHAELRGAVEREEKFEPLVPRHTRREAARAEVEQLDEKGKLARERFAVAAGFVELPRDVVQREFQLRGGFVQRCRGCRQLSFRFRFG